MWVSWSPSDLQKSQCIDPCIQILQICVNKHEYDIHIKFEISLHFWPIWPTVCLLLCSSSLKLFMGSLGQSNMIFLHAGRWSFLLLKLWFSSKLVSKINYKKMASTWRDFKNISFTICTWPNRPVRAKFLPRFQFEGKTDVWISQVRRVKTWLQFVFEKALIIL